MATIKIMVNGKQVDTINLPKITEAQLEDYVRHSPQVRKELGGFISKEVKLTFKEGQVEVEGKTSSPFIPAPVAKVPEVPVGKAPVTEVKVPVNPASVPAPVKPVQPPTKAIPAAPVKPVVPKVP